MIPNPKPQHGKHLVVFDPNPAPACEQSEANMLLVRTARSLFNLALTTENSERDKCLQKSFKMLHRWSQMGDLAWQGPEGPRMKNCVEIKRI